MIVEISTVFDTLLLSLLDCAVNIQSHGVDDSACEVPKRTAESINGRSPVGTRIKWLNKTRSELFSDLMQRDVSAWLIRS